MKNENQGMPLQSARNKSMSGKEFIVFTATLISIVAISIDALLPALGIITQDFGVSDPNSTQLLISALFLGSATGQLICGPLSDALGRKPVLYAGLFVYFLGTLLCLLSNDLNSLLTGRFIQGLGVAGPYISAVSLVRDKFKGQDMAQVMSVVMMIFVLVPALAPSLGQAILYMANWRGIFILYGIYAFIILIWIYFRLPESLPKEKRIPLSANGVKYGFKEVMKNKNTRRLMICMGIIFGCLIGYLNSSQQIFQEHFKTGELFSVYFGMLASILGVASLLNSRLVSKLGMHFIASRAFGLIVISSILFISLQLMIDIKLWMFLIYAIFLFFSIGLIFGNLNAMAMEPMGHVAGIASAVIGATSSIISMSIGTIIGQLYNDSVLPMACAFLLMSTIGSIILSTLDKTPSSLQAEPDEQT